MLAGACVDGGEPVAIGGRQGRLIAELRELQPEDPKFKANTTVLGEYVKHHVKEEEGEMFPMARKADMDLDALGAKLLQRKAELADDSRQPARRRSARTGSKPATNGRRQAAKTAARKSPTTTRRH